MLNVKDQNVSSKPTGREEDRSTSAQREDRRDERAPREDNTNKTTLSGLRGFTRKALSGNRLDASLAQLREGIAAQLANSTEKSVEYQVQILNKDDYAGLGISAVVVIGVDRSTNIDVAATVFLMASTANTEASIIREGDISYEAKPLPYDLVDSTMDDALEKLFSQVLPSGIREPIVTYIVIPRRLNTSDEQTQGTIAAIAGNGILNKLDFTAAGKRDVNLIKDVAQGDLSVRKTWNGYQEQECDALGNPVRADIHSIQSESTDKTRQSSSMITRTGLYVEMVHNGEAGLGDSYGRGAPPPLYKPRLVITKVETPVLQSYGMFWMAIGHTLTIVDNQRWINSFLPQKYRPNNEFNLREYGSTGLEFNYSDDRNAEGALINTDGISDSKLLGMVSTSMSRNPELCIDILEGGPQSALMAGVDQAVEVKSAAYTQLLESANELTNAKLQELVESGRYDWKFGDPILVDYGMRILAGNYTDAKGQRRDSRDFDYLAYLNILAGRGEDMMKIYDDATNGLIKTTLALADQRRLLTAVVSENNFEEVGQYIRLMFNPAFLVVFIDALKDIGLVWEESDNDFRFANKTRVGRRFDSNMSVFELGTSSMNRRDTRDSRDRNNFRRGR